MKRLINSVFATVIAVGVFGSLAAQAHERGYTHSHGGSHGGYSGGGYNGGGYGGGHGGYDNYDRPSVVTRRAKVVHVEPIYEEGRRQYREKTVCHTEQVPVYGYSHGYGGYRGEPNAAGALAGAVIGGVIGNKVADNEARGTIVGGVAGAILGAQVGRSYHGGYGGGQRIVGYEPKQVCNTVQQPEYGPRRIKGYNVTYRLRGQHYKTFTRYDPGSHIDVQVYR